MPDINQLSPDTQNLILSSFEFFGKKFLIGIAIIFSLFYVFYFYKRQKKTPYIAFGILRIMLLIMSWITIIIFPMMLFVMYPQISLELLLKWMLIFYTTGFIIVGFVVTLNIYWWSGMILFRFGGFEGDKRVNKVIDRTINAYLVALGFKKLKIRPVIKQLNNDR